MEGLSSRSLQSPSLHRAPCYLPLRNRLRMGQISNLRFLLQILPSVFCLHLNKQPGEIRLSHSYVHSCHGLNTGGVPTNDPCVWKAWSPAAGTTQRRLLHRDANFIHGFIFPNGLLGGPSCLEEVRHWRPAFEGYLHPSLSLLSDCRKHVPLVT